MGAGLNRFCGFAGIVLLAVSGTSVPASAQQAADHKLEATLDCDAETIAIGALPRLGCHVTITRMRTDTADPVQLKLLYSKDAIGNTQQGLQVSGAGTIDPSAVSLPYRWDLSVFACPGANTCLKPAYPERSFISLELSQAGAKPLKLLKYIAVTGPAYAGPGLAGRELRFGSASNAARFLRLGADKKRVELDYITTTYTLAIWEVESVEGTTFVRLRNNRERGHYLHMEKGPLEIGHANPKAETTHWEILGLPGTYFYTLSNRARPESYLRVQDGKVAAGPGDTATLDAQWWVLQ